MLVRRLTTGLVLLVVLSLFACTTWKKPNDAGWTSATSMEEHERLMWKSVQAGDWQQVNAHMAGDFMGVTPGGVRDRAATLEHLQQMKISDYSLGEFQTRPAGTDMVVTYVITLKGTAAGQPLPTRPMRVISVWQTVKRGWVQISQAVVPAQTEASTTP